jgi:hypothetical protein
MATPAQTIQDALQRVAQFRQQHAGDPALAQAMAEVKRFQARRFQATYADLLHNPRYARAARFFLQELYSDRDYASRDQQFARIASTIAKLFPQPVVATAAALAEVHALTETLDDRMAHAWHADRLASPQDGEPARYVRCWRQSGDRAARQHQLAMVVQLGEELDRLTRTRGLRTLLRLMRGPAAAAGLDALQQFLETGFDAFAQMGGAEEFLMLVRQRESEWIRALFDDGDVDCATKLSHLLATEEAH